MLPSASVLAYRREERVQKAFSGDHHGHGDARLRARATPSQRPKMRLCAGVWAPFPLSLDQIWKDGRPFTSVKRVRKACISLMVKEITHELDESGVFKATFRAILSNFEQF
eukprot:scaffold56938_cov39-Phaeocystis_antarctica.AAC.2